MLRIGRRPRGALEKLPVSSSVPEILDPIGGGSSDRAEDLQRIGRIRCGVGRSASLVIDARSSPVSAHRGSSGYRHQVERCLGSGGTWLVPATLAPATERVGAVQDPGPTHDPTFGEFPLDESRRIPRRRHRCIPASSGRALWPASVAVGSRPGPAVARPCSASSPRSTPTRPGADGPARPAAAPTAPEPSRPIDRSSNQPPPTRREHAKGRRPRFRTGG